LIRVLDLTHYVAGPFATLVLAELGADVIKVERPDGGDPWRTLCKADDPVVGFDFLNRRKKSVTLDLKSDEGRRKLLELLEDADAVIENFRPGVMGRLGLSFEQLRQANPDIVLTSISNFGQAGPRRYWEASELVLQSMGGFVQGTGWEDGPPLKLGGRVAEHLAGLNAAIATVISVYGVRMGSEPGVHNDISIQEAFAAHGARHISVWAYSGMGMRRATRGVGPQGFPNLLPAKDGDLYVLATRAEWEFFAHFLGLDDFISHEWSDPAVRRERWSEIDPHYRAAIASRGRYEWFQDGAEHGFTFAPVDDVYTLQGSPQFASRGFFDSAELSDGSRVPCPRLPFSGFPTPETANRAPRLGEHNAEILEE
jgi:CoA:oxalate CoA-transferase